MISSDTVAGVIGAASKAGKKVVVSIKKGDRLASPWNILISFCQQVSCQMRSCVLDLECPSEAALTSSGSLSDGSLAEEGFASVAPLCCTLLWAFAAACLALFTSLSYFLGSAFCEARGFAVECVNEEGSGEDGVDEGLIGEDPIPELSGDDSC